MNTLSIYFCLFAVIIFPSYWLAAKVGRKLQNVLTIAAGLIFIGFADYRFAIMLALVTLVAYFAGFWAEKISGSLWVSIPLLLSPLLLFKYFNLFATTFGADAIKLILPLGISFYTFMAVAYVVDVAKAKIKAERSVLDFGAFMMFFPQLTAGPIGRADKMLPVFKSVRVFDYELAAEGCRQILWGAFKKMYIADCLGKLVSAPFANPGGYGFASLWMAAVLYSIQIYADFSGYTDIAIGIGKLFGVKLMKNFDNPYFATTIGDFWRRWHISLTTWFRDYLYFPLGGSRAGKFKTVRNTMIVFLVSGLWHGANWMFAIWGALHGFFLVVERLLKLDRVKTIVRYPVMIVAVVLAWVAFRAESLPLMGDFYRGMFGRGECIGQTIKYRAMIEPIVCMFVGEALWTLKDKPILKAAFKYLMLPYVKWPAYIYLIYVIFLNHPSDSLFIYAQF